MCAGIVFWQQIVYFPFINGYTNNVCLVCMDTRASLKNACFFAVTPGLYCLHSICNSLCERNSLASFNYAESVTHYLNEHLLCVGLIRARKEDAHLKGQH